MREVITHLVAEAKKDGIARLVVGALINHNQKVLCLKRAGNDFMPGLYELPSGKVEANEDLDIALAREVKEESNLTVTEINQYIGHFDYKSRSGISTRQLNFVVSVNPQDKVVLNPAEHEGYSWVSATEIKNYNISAEVQKLIREHLSPNLIASPTSPQLFKSSEKRERDEGDDASKNNDLNTRSTKMPSLGNTGEK